MKSLSSISQNDSFSFEEVKIIGIDFEGNYIYSMIPKEQYNDAGQRKEKKIMESIILFDEKIDEWLEYEKISVKISTYSYYRTIVETHIRKDLGMYPIFSLTDKIITDFINNLINKNTFSASSVRQVLKILKQIIKFADLKVNVKMPKPKKKEIKILSANENETLLEYLFSNINNETFGILLSINLGLRKGEVCALRWSNINFENATIKIEKTLERIKRFDTPTNSKKTTLVLLDAKTDHSSRVLPLNNQLLEIASRLYKNDDSYIITATNNYMDPRTFYNHYKKILEKCNLDNTYHCLRHTFATNCVDSGLNVKAVSQILGHSDIKTTLALYVHPDLSKTRDFLNNNFTY